MKKQLLILLASLTLLAGCATDGAVSVTVYDPWPPVYYGWYGDYYGPWYWGPTGIVVFGCPSHWHGSYHHYSHHYAPHYRHPAPYVAPHRAPAPAPRMTQPPQRQAPPRAVPQQPSRPAPRAPNHR